jgi:hypothetical protein
MEADGDAVDAGNQILDLVLVHTSILVETISYTKFVLLRVRSVSINIQRKWHMVSKVVSVDDFQSFRKDINQFFPVRTILSIRRTLGGASCHALEVR